MAPHNVSLHPAQLYEVTLDLLLAAFLHQRLKIETLPSGIVFWDYVLGMGAIRLVIQFFRDDDRDALIAGMAHSQYMAILWIIVALLMIRRLNTLSDKSSRQ